MKIFKNILFLAILVAVSGNYTAYAQKYVDKNGEIVFEASEKLFEEVKAETETATAIFNAETNQIASLALVKGFRFKNSLMQEHFNENYIESDTYPKATFKGELVDFDSSKLTTTTIEAMVNGSLELHGKEKEVSTKLAVRKEGDSIYMTGEFKVTPDDFDIDIPSVVRNKIAKEVLIKINFKLIQK